MTTTPAALVRQLAATGADPRQFARELLDFVVWLDAADHRADELAERYDMTTTQVLDAIRRHEGALKACPGSAPH